MCLVFKSSSLSANFVTPGKGVSCASLVTGDDIFRPAEAKLPSYPTLQNLQLVVNFNSATTKPLCKPYRLVSEYNL
jgi:hypothetical protein